MDPLAMSSDSSSSPPRTNLPMDLVYVEQRHAVPSSSRILDIECKVCGDFSSGKHYNIYACDGCAGFFKRSIRRKRQYTCKARTKGMCIVDKTHRNQCRACRLAKCEEAGMNKEAVQHERGPRNATLRRQQMPQYVPPYPLDLVLQRPPGGHTPPLQIPDHAMLLPPFMFNPANQFLPRIPFMLPQTQMLYPMTFSNVCEIAARLVFMNVQWTQNLATFKLLPLPDQMVLLEESWRELFVLGASQLMPGDLTHLVDGNELDRNDILACYTKVKQFDGLLQRIIALNLDMNEYSSLKAIILFKTSFDKPPSQEGPKLLDPLAIAAIQQRTQVALNSYVSSTYPTQPLRYTHMLTLLPCLRTMPGEVIEEIFFRKTIGSIPIGRLITDMYAKPALDVHIPRI